MRTINIDLTKNYNNPVFVGYEGEHNQTMLNIKIPDDIINELYTYRVMFETSLDEKYTLEPLGNEDDSIISTYLNANVTKKGILYIQVEAFQTDENANDTVYTLIGKTIKMPLLIKESVGGEVGSDEDISADKIAQLEALIATKQDKIEGKGLSTNDFTNELKATLENIDQTFITNTVNNLTNYYLKSETYSKSEVNQLIGAIPKFKIEVVNQLPITDISTATVYLVTTGAESQNLYTEYIYVNNAWEKLGTQTVDLTGYATQTWVSSQIADFLTATEVSNVINTALSQYYDMNDIDDMLNRKVNTVSGKGLSTEDYTTAEKTKLAGIEDGAEANVQSDWSQSNSSADDYIKNKPQNLVQDSSYVHTDNNFNNDYKSKIETNEYNDIFNIRVEWDRQYMPHAELIKINFQGYENGVLVDQTATSGDVKDITNGNVYLYKPSRNYWQIAVGTPPSSYHRLPMLVGKIATKTVGGESVKLFFRNDEDETQFDKLNSVKVDKETWELIDTVTLEEEVFEINKNVDSDGNALKLKAIKILASLGSSSTSTAELVINAYSDNNYNSTVGLCTERLALPDAKINYVAEQQNGYWNAEWSGRRAATNYKGGYFLQPAFSTLSVTSKPYIRSWKVKTPTSNVTFSTSTTIEIWGIRGE